MDKIGMFLSIAWAIVIALGIGAGYLSKEINTGEFYICLMMWAYLTTWFIERNGEDKWKK